MSYLTKFESIDSEEVYYIWIFLAAITTLYSYAWDLKKDWGLLEPG